MQINSAFLDLSYFNDVVVENEIQEEFERKVHNALFAAGVFQLKSKLNVIAKEHSPVLAKEVNDIISINKEGLLFLGEPLVGGQFLHDIASENDKAIEVLMANLEVMKNETIELAQIYEVILSQKHQYLQSVFQEVLEEDFPSLKDGFTMIGYKTPLKTCLTVLKVKEDYVYPIRYKSNTFNSKEYKQYLEISIREEPQNSTILILPNVEMPFSYLNSRNKEKLKKLFSKEIKSKFESFKYHKTKSIGDYIRNGISGDVKHLAPIRVLTLNSQPRVTMRNSLLIFEVPINLSYDLAQSLILFTDKILGLPYKYLKYLSRFKFYTNPNIKGFSFETGEASIYVTDSEIKEVLLTLTSIEAEMDLFLETQDPNFLFKEELPRVSPFLFKKKFYKDGRLLKIQYKTSENRKSNYLYFFDGKLISSRTFYRKSRE